MKKKNIINLIGLGILIILTAIILVNNNKDSTVNTELTDFSMKDTASISKLFIADMKGQSVLLTKEEDVWIVNNEFIANDTRIENVMNLLPKIELKGIVPTSAQENVIKTMSTSSVKVEIYTVNPDKPFKTIYVGKPTTDQEGTYMAIDRGKRKEKVPYIVHDPTFRGYLSDGYFYTNESEWRTKEVFRLKPTDIKKATIIYRLQPHNSFTLLIEKGLNNFRISNNIIDFPLDSIDLKQVKKFLVGFEDMSFVAEEQNLTDTKKDSILKNKPVIIVSLIDQQDKEYQLSLYFKPSDLRTRVELMEGVDKERYLGITSERPDDVLIFQTLRLSRILWKIEDFKIKK